MSSPEHQKLINSLAKALESDGVTITHLDIDGTPEYFDEKYRNLPTPKECDGRIPDLQGRKDDVIHLGEAKTDIYGVDNIDAQLQAFSGRQMVDNGRPVPLHVVVSSNLKNDLKKKINELGLSDKLISIWS